MITIPNVKNKNSNTGIVIGSGGHAYAEYTEGTRKRRRKIGMAPAKKSDWLQLRINRDRVYLELWGQGAKVATRAVDPKESAVGNPDRYIQKRKPFVVRIKNKIIAECDTRKEARAARNKHLGIFVNDKTQPQ